MNDMRVEQKEFKDIIKLFKDVSITDSIMVDMFLTFAKKLGQP